MALRSISNATIVKSIIVASVVLGTLIGALVITLAVTLTIKSGSNGQFTDYIKGYKNSDIVIQPTISTTSSSSPPQLDISQQGLEKPYHGAIRLGSNNTIIYHSEKYFSGNDTFEYYITFGESSSLKVKNRISVLVLNRDPKAVPLTFEIPKNSRNNVIDIFTSNDKFGLKVTDDDDDILELVSVSTPKLSGSVVSSNSKQIIYTPCTNCIGVDSFTYTVTDFNSTVSSTITINLVNTPPSAVKDDFTIPKNKLATLNVLSNDIDENLDELYIISSGEGSIGSVVVSTDKKSLIYYPKADTKPYVDVFSYVITDDLTNPNSSSTGSIHVTVTNSPPNAPESKQVSVSKNSANSTIDLTFTDNDILDTVTVEILTTPKRGYFSFVQQKYIDSVDYLGQIYVDVLKLRYQLLYSPEKGVSYSETFNVKVSDGYSTLTTSVIINVVNTPPISVNDTITCTKNNEVVVDVITNDYDVDGDSIKLSTTDWEPNSFNGGEVFRTDDKSIRYKAPQGFVGVDTVRYYITDGESISYGFLTVNVQAVKPVAVNDVFLVPKGLKTFLNVMSNDYSPSKDEILLSLATIRSVEQSNVVRSLRNNIYGYEYSASDVAYVDTFSYKVVDAFGLTSDAAVVTVKVINTPPKAVDDVISVSWNRDAVLNVLQNDYDENPSDNQLLVVTRTIHGENQTVPTPVIFESGKKLLLSPPNGFTGSFEFFYVISDTFDESNVAKVTVSIVNHQPVANNDNVNVRWRDGVVVINALQNDSDQDGDTLIIKSFTQPSKGFVVKKALPDGTEVFEYSILASTEFVGIDTFEYEITDNGKSANATVYVNVTNFAPVAREDSFNVHWNAEQQEYDVLANDFDGDSDPFNIIPGSLVLSNQFNGQVEINPDGTALKFKPSVTGVFTLTYRISDIVSQSFNTKVTFNVTNLDKPLIRTIEKNIHWTMNQPISIPITTFTRDSDGDLLYISSELVKQPNNGTIENVNYGDENTVPSLVYKKNPGFFGSDNIQVLLNDGLDSAIVSIKVNSINQIPTCKRTIKESVFWKNLPYVRNSLLISNAVDQDSEDIVHLKSVANSFGDISVNGDEITFSPLKGFIDERSAQLLFTDGLDICTSILNIKVNDSKPQASPTLSMIHWSKSSALIDVLSTIVDADGDSCDFSIRSQSDYTIGSASIELNSNTKFVKWTVSNDKNLGESTFDIEYTDGYLTDVATYTVKVYNNPPIIPEKTIEVHWSKYINGISINLLQDVIDNDVQDTVSIPLNSWVTSKVGTITMTSDKVALYKPKQAYLGDDEINFTVTDGLAIVNATYYIKVINRKPVAVDDNVSVHWNDTSVEINVLANDYDPDQEDTIYIAALLTEPSAGRIEKISTTTVRYYLPEDHSVLGDVTFRYSVTDGTEVAEATVTVDIVNRDYPKEASISRSIHWREVVTGLPINIVPSKNDQDGDLIFLNILDSNNPAIFSISNDVDLLVKSEGPIKGEFNASVSIFDGISIANAFVHTSIYNHAPTSKDLYFNFHWSTISKGVYIDLVQRSNDVDLQDKSKLFIKHAEVIEGPDANAVTIVNNTLYFKPSILEIGNTTINFVISDGFEDSDLHTMIIESRSVVALKADQYYDAHWRSFAFGNIYALDQSFSNEEMITLLDIIQLPNQGGMVNISTIRNVTYYPKENFIGTEVFAVSYTTGITSSNITVHVNVYNNNPQGAPKEYDTHWRNPVLMNVLNGAYDQDEYDRFYLFPELVEGPETGILSEIAHDGSVTFTPNITSGYIGTTTFYFRINDGNKVSSPTPVTININNNPPTANTKELNIMWKNFLDGVEFDIISTNPTDTDTDSFDIPFLFIKSFNQPLPFGDVSRLSSSKVKIQGSSSFLGSTSFTYVLSDGAHNGDSTGTINVHVYNNKPNLTQDSITTHWNVDFIDIDVLSNDFDIDNNPLTITTLKNYASAESQIIFNNKVRYYPRTCAASSDKFTYVVYDGIESSESEVNVIILNNKPIAKNYNTSHIWHNVIGGVVFDIVAESVDLDGDSISIVKFSPIPVEQGTLQFTNNNKSIIYTPRVGFVGSVETISYVITDGRDEVSGTVDIEITNNFPSLSVPSVSTHWRSALEGTLFDLSSNFVDRDGDNVILKDVITQATKGTVEITDSKTIKYQSSFAFKGTDSFTLQLSDGYNFVIVSLEIDVSNNLPTLSDITIQTLHRLSGNVIISLINRTDSFKPKDLDVLDNDKLTITAFTQPGIGSVVFSDANQISFEFSNVLGNLLEQTFSYTVSDGLESASATITIQILNNAPILIDATKSFHWRSIYEQGGSVALDILKESNAVDADDDTLFVKSFTQPSVGSVSLLNTSHITFTPVAFKAFTTNFKFTVSDGAQQVEKQFDISVTNTNPKAVDDNLNKLWSNKLFTFSPLVNDYDDNNDQITIVPESTEKVSRLRSASITVNDDLKTITYSDSGSLTTGSDSFSYTITDGVATSTAIVYITFTNTEPSVESFGVIVKWDQSITLDNLLGRCKDLDGDALSFVGITQQGMLGTTQLIDSQIGKAQYTPNRALTYTNKPLDGNWTVVDTIQYSCTDSVVQKAGTISITIYNEPPKAKDISISQVRNYNNPQIIIDGYSILSQSSDSNADPITITKVKLYDNQDIETSAVLQADSSIKFKYGKSFIGTQKFYFTISDGQLENTYTYTVQILGSPSLCIDYTISTFKDALSTAFGADLNSKLNLAFDGEPISVSVSGTATLSSVGTISTIDNTLTYFPNKRRSCIDNACYATYTAINAAGQSATCKIIVNQANQAPNNPSYTYKYSARRDGNNLITFDYIADAAVRDPDSTDSVSIQSVSSLGTCSGLATISISNGKISFTRQASFLASTCTFTIKLQDDDELTPAYNIASITVNPTISPPLAVADAIMATFNTNRDIDVSVLLQNDVDLLGGTFTFDGLFCPDATYCKNGLPTLLNANTIRIPFKTGSCEAEKVQYRIKSTQDGSVAYANIVVRYSGCVCTNIFDVVFIVDGSYSISDANWVSLKSFFSNITQSLNVGPSATRIGIVQYSADATVELDLTSGTSSNDIVTRISNIAQKKSSTASIYGIDKAVDLMVSQGRSDVPNKLFIHVTDGQSNMPCSCGECQNYYGSFEGCNSVLYPGKSCDYCSWSDPQSRCAPCSDYTEKCQRINKWRSGNNDNPESSKNWNYRMMAIGIGEGVNNPYGLVQLEKSNYDPSLFHVFDWNNLNYKMIVDESCATSYNIYGETPLQNTSYADSQIIVQYSGRSVVNQSNIASTTFTYTLTAPTSTKQKSIKKFVLSNSISDPESYVSYNPAFPVFVGTESLTNLFGFVWDSIPSSSLVPMGSSKTVTITVCGDVPESMVSFGVVSESFITYSSIKGPATSQCIDKPVIDPNTQCFTKSGASACSGHGLCVQPDLCQCSSGYTGTECQTPICFDLTGNFACSGTSKGTCTGPNTCQCQTGWTGTDCSIPICYGLAANNAGSCSGSSKGTCISKDTCQCQTGWTGSDCSVPICYSKTGNSACSGPSQGSCVSKDTCQCQTGWTGPECSIPICYGLAANNAGSCSGSSKGTCISKDTCQCQDGWTGSDCSIPVCFGRTQNDPLACSGSSKGSCVSKGSCSCQTGWTGFDCSLPICYGVNSTSTSVCGGSSRGTCTSKDTCNCQSGWTGSDCTTPICYGNSGSSACGGSSKGTCTSPNSCSCLTGWTGADCTTPICYSQTGSSACGGSSKGTCTGPNTCQCQSGWTGSDCTTPICYSQTGSSACGGSSKGTCTAPNTCQCQSGWSGSDCTTPVCPGNCNGRGSCVAPNSCSCNSGWSGSDCSVPVCSGGCGNGYCSSPGTCTCNSGWNGATCTSPICSGGCGNGACTAPGTCSCNSGWNGATCSNPICSTCNGRGSCVGPESCSCNSGWTGNLCQTPVCSGNCNGRGSCVAPNSCSCNSGWSGSDCSVPVCSGGCGQGTCSSPGSCSCNSGWSGSTCSTPVCSGGCGQGSCTSPGSCSCNSGWSGSKCTTPICSGGCGQGSCTSPGTCSCNSGWSGSTCSTPVCSGGCGQGSCTSPGTCTCNSGWSGSTCTTPVCSAGCGHGTCTAPGTCSCSSGWNGATCSNPICSTCNGRGSCTAPESCSCNSGWSGNLCQNPVCSTCNGRGSCVGPESCSCNSGWSGNLCQTATCVNNCNGRGTCTGPNTCSCQSGYSGSACETCTNCCNGVPAGNADVCSGQGTCVNGACRCYPYACGGNCQQCGCNGNYCP